MKSSYGVLFDLDGVLIDSHDQHQQSWFLLADEISQPLTEEQFKESFGMRNEMCIPDVFGWAKPEEAEKIQQLGDRKEELYRELLATSGLEPLPGVMSLVADLKESGIPFSLGSSTSRKNIEVCFRATGLDAYFLANYTGAEDVSQGKPAPDVFLEAARKIGCESANCVVIEDAHVGIEAARAGAMKAIAVTTTHPRSSFSDLAPEITVDSLEELSAEKILDLFSN